MPGHSSTLAVVAALTIACGSEPKTPAVDKEPATAKATPPPTRAEPELEPEPEPPAKPAPIPVGHVKTTDALVLPHMYWAPSRYLLGRDFIYVARGTVVELAKMKPDSPQIRGNRWIFEARIEVHDTLLDRPPKGRSPRGPEDQPKFVVSELADRLAIGDRVIVFGLEYDGGYGMIEALGSNARLGIKVQTWDDPINAAVEALVGGSADLTDAKQADAWRPFGEAAIQCFIDRTPVGMCE